MSYKDKLSFLRTGIMNFVSKGELVVDDNTSHALDTFDNSLDELLEETLNTNITNLSVSGLKDVVRLIIVLDASISMKGTEDDIVLGLQDLVKHHKNDNILINLVVFNGKTHVLLDDVYISNVKIPEIYACGSTNLNDSLYITMQAKCSEGVNLLVVISDGEDTDNEISASSVRDLMDRLVSKHNHFYFLGEPNERQTPEDVYALACKLGFNQDNISIFTREGNGNRLNFIVISEMLEELLKYGTISKDWSKKIRTHYLELKEKRY